MTKTAHDAYPNPDLMVGPDNLSSWSRADTRRWGFHNLHTLSRASFSLRAPAVLPLKKSADMRILDLPRVQKLTTTPFLSAMAVVCGGDVIYERYAPDFGPDRVHSMQSITKTTVHLMIANLAGQGLLDMNQRVDHYLPEMGSGYAGATVQQVANMDVINNYSEDYGDVHADVFAQEVAMGWRLPYGDSAEESLRGFVVGVESDDTTNHTGAADYKSANTDVLGWIAERITGRTLRTMLLDIIEAAGIEGTFHISCDREGVPVVSGGGLLTARDLARYGLLLARHGHGVEGRQVGDAAFTAQSIAHPGPAMPEPRSWMSYSNQLMTNGRWIGHGGYGGQFLFADPPTDMAMAFYSVLENREAIDTDYYTDVVQTGVEIAALLESGAP
ncbi:MAG: serine hydrolase [Pseudomonadota bacterium]